MTGEGVSAAVEQLLAQIAEADRQLTEDLIYALHTYISAETRLIPLDSNVGKDVEYPLERLARLEFVLARLELELGI